MNAWWTKIIVKHMWRQFQNASHCQNLWKRLTFADFYICYIYKYINHFIRNTNKKISHLLLFTEKSTKAALNAFLFLSSCDRSCRSGTHRRLYVQMRRRQLSDRQSNAGEVVLVQTVLAAVAWGQWGRRSSRIQCAVVMLSMPAAWSANLISISTLIDAATF